MKKSRIAQTYRVGGGRARGIESTSVAENHRNTHLKMGKVSDNNPCIEQTRSR